MISFYSIPPFVSASISLLLGIFVVTRSNKSFSSFSLASICFGIAVWLYSYSFCYSSRDSITALFWARNSYFGIILIPVAVYQLAISLLNQKSKRLLIVFYALGFVFLILSRTNYFFAGVRAYFWGYYPQATYLYHPFLIFFFGIYSYACFLIFLALRDKQINLHKRNQLKYIFIAYVIAAGASVDYLGKYGFQIYPFGYLNMVCFALVLCYAIVRYRLLDISLVITRTSIFIAVYSLVLGIPFALAFGWRGKLISLLNESWWMVPLVTSTVLATVGPFIYVFVQKRAEDRLFQEQRRYQATLRQASAGMGKIKDLKRLVTLIVHIMTRTVRVEFSMVFLNDVYAKKFRLGAYRSRTARVKFCSDIDNATAVVTVLKETQGPIVYDEIRQRTQDYGDLKLARLEAELKAMDAALVVPSFIDEKLVAILVMGNKISGKTYSSDDLSVFTIFSQQVALALRNLRAMEEVKKAQEQLFHSEKLAYIGQLAATVAHEVRNPLTAIKTFVNYLPEKFRTHDVEFLQRFENLIPGEILRIEKIVHQLIDLARPRQAHKSQESIGEILARTLDLLKDNIAMRNIRLEKEMTDKDDRVLCDAEQIQQVMLNLILNALDVMSDGGKLTVKLWGQQQEDGRWVMFSVRDTGCGISPENLKKLFTPFQTTKPKGLGLGLVIVEEIVKLHQGKITATSQLGQGTEFVVSLPA